MTPSREQMWRPRLRVAIGADGQASFRAAPGDYWLVGEAGALLAPVQIPVEGRTISLE